MPIKPANTNLSSEPQAGNRWAALLLLVAMVAAACVCFGLSLLLPVGLDVRSDVIGFPTYYDFDSRHYLTLKKLWLIGWPLLSAVGFWLGYKYLTPIGGAWWQQPVRRYIKPYIDETPPSLAVMLLLMPATIAAPWMLYLLSEVTTVTLADSGEVVHYRWFPLWLAGLMSLVAGIIIRREPTALPSLSILYISTAMLWPVFGGLPGALGPVDYFHEGEMLVPGAGLLEGLLPWRDLQMIHGPFFDAVRGALGQVVFEPSRWGTVAGIHAILNPLYFITWFVFFAWLARGQVVLAFLATLAVASLDPFVHVRLLFLAPLLLATGWFLTAPSIKRAFLMVGIGVVLAIGTPEAVFAPLAVAVVVVLRDLLEPRPWAFTATKPAVIAGVVLGGLTFALLGAAGMLPGMLHHLLEFSRDHDLAGAIPFGQDTRVFTIGGLGLAVLALIIITLIAQFWTWWQARAEGEALDVRGWVMIAAALFAALYFQKLVNRLDGHVFHVIAASAPVIGWSLMALIQRLQNRLPYPAGEWQPLAILAIIAIAATGPAWIKDQREGMKARWAAPAPDLVPWRVLDQWQPMVASAPRHEKLGYAMPEAEQETALIEWPALIEEYGLAGLPVLDVTNRPGLFFYLLDLKPASDFFYISMALRQSSMELVTDDLTQGFAAIMPRGRGWDGIPDLVRHYDVSAEILERNQPVADAPGSVLYMPEPASGRPALAAGLVACDWGAAPAYLAGPSDPDWQMIDATQRQEAEAVRVAGWSLDPARMQPARLIRLLRNGERFIDIDVGEPRPDVVTAFGRNRNVLRSGFDRVITMPQGMLEEITAEAIMPDGRVVPFSREHSAYGGFDALEVVSGGRDVARWSHGHERGGWLRISGAKAGQDFTLAPAAETARWQPQPITFSKPAHLDDERPLYLRLDACPGFMGRGLVLTAADRGELGDVEIAASE